MELIRIILSSPPLIPSLWFSPIPVSPSFHLTLYYSLNSVICSVNPAFKMDKTSYDRLDLRQLQISRVKTTKDRRSKKLEALLIRSHVEVSSRKDWTEAEIGLFSSKGLAIQGTMQGVEYPVKWSDLLIDSL